MRWPHINIRSGSISHDREESSPASAQQILAAGRHGRAAFRQLVMIAVAACVIGVPILLLTGNSIQIPWLVVPSIIIVSAYVLDWLRDYLFETELANVAERARMHVASRQKEREARRHGHQARQLQVERLREQGAPFHVGNDGEIVFEQDIKHPEDSKHDKGQE